MKRFPLWQVILLTVTLVSCRSHHLTGDRSYREAVRKDYKIRSERFGERRPDLFSAVGSAANQQQREALQFLLAYMPLSDIAFYDPEFLKANVDAALSTRKEMTWGESVPYEIFLHFVLPQRVNNENLDSFRLVYRDEIHARIIGLDASAAALEINHWCHEKVAYQPADIRTSAPMATILSARGRCGEESVFTVSALRAAGLPARQVYTPRWAHSDDNHAWVEVWIDGNWYYMGACEPEPVLDRGWFTVPATRAMLVHSKAFGRYNGDEPLVKRENLYSEINALGKYAVTKDLRVLVADEKGIPVPAAAVDFLLYNYAEFYPIASLVTDDRGECSFTTGKGSLLVWARVDEKYGFEYVSPATDSITVSVTADRLHDILPLDLKAPDAGPANQAPSDKQMRENASRLEREDNIRLAYTKSWLNCVSMSDLAGDTQSDSAEIYRLLTTSMGNWSSILTFIRQSGKKAGLALRLLETVSEKDLRDTPAAVLKDHLDNAPENTNGYDQEFYDTWVLNPRVAEELLSPFRSELKLAFQGEPAGTYADPAEIVRWIEASVTVDDSENYYGTPLIPSSVEKLRTSDHRSRDIFFVALCRTGGHAARLEPGTGRPQYFSAGVWTDVWFSDAVKPSGVKSYVTFTSVETNPKPEYSIHFTLARFENGRYRTLEFGENVGIDAMQKNIPLDPGKYMLVTGNRNGSGNVLAELAFFELLPHDTTVIQVRLRNKKEETLVKGKIDSGRTIILADGKMSPLLLLKEKGVIILWIDPGTEPTRHIFRDLPLLREEFDEWGGYLLFMLRGGAESSSFDPSDLAGLPQNSLFCLDENHEFLKSVWSEEYSGFRFPVVIYADSTGNILFSSQGYRIGIGEQLLKSIK